MRQSVFTMCNVVDISNISSYLQNFCISLFAGEDMNFVEFMLQLTL